MENFRFKHIGQPDNVSFSFPQKRTSRPDAARAGPSLLDRMSQGEKSLPETSIADHTDAAPHPTRVPKAARQPKQRVRTEHSLADRISAPDSSALLNRISGPDVQPRRSEARVSPPTKRGSSDRGGSAESPPRSAQIQLHNTDKIAAPLRRNSPPQSPLKKVPQASPTTSMHIDPVANPSANASLSSTSPSPSAASTGPAHQSGLDTNQPSSPSVNHHLNLQSSVSISPIVLPSSQIVLSAEPQVPQQSTSTSLSTALPTSAAPIAATLTSTSPVSSPSSHTSGASVVASASPSLNKMSAPSRRRSATPASSPTKTASDLLAFYLKPLWAESAAQMREWAEVANERVYGESSVSEFSLQASETRQDRRGDLEKVRDMLPQSDNRGEKPKKKGKDISIEEQTGREELEKEKGKEEEKKKKNEDHKKNQEEIQDKGDRGVLRKRALSEDDGSAETETRAAMKRIKLSEMHRPIASITPPPATPSMSHQAAPVLEAELEVVEQESTIIQRHSEDNDAIIEQPTKLISPQDAGKTIQDAIDDTSAHGINKSLWMLKAASLPETHTPEDHTAPPEGTSPEAGTTEPQEQLSNDTDSSTTTEAIDEATVIRRRNLEQELAFHVREEQKRMRQLETARLREGAVERALKKREEELREAMKKRRMEKAETQAVPSTSNVPVQATDFTPGAATLPNSTSSPVTAHASPQRVPHPLPPKPRPLSGDVFLDTSTSGKIAPLSPQAIAHSALASSIPNPQNRRVISTSSNTESPRSPGRNADVVQPPQPAPSAVLLPATIAHHHVLSPVTVKKEEPRTPSIPRVAVNVVPPTEQKPVPLTNASTLVSSVHPPFFSRVSPDPQAKNLSTQGLSGSTHAPVKSEPSLEDHLQYPVSASAKRPRSPSLAASIPPAIKKRRESSPPAVDLELSYPDAVSENVSETSGWGHVDVEQDDEERRRPGGRRRVRTQTPDGEGRGPHDPVTPPRRQRSRSKSRSHSRSPLRAARGRGLLTPRGPRVRGSGWNARGRPMDRYESRYPPRSSSPRRVARSRSPVGARPAYDHYSPPPSWQTRGRLGPGGADGYSSSYRPYDFPNDRWAPHIPPQPLGPRHDHDVLERRRSPSRELDSFSVRRLPPVEPQNQYRRSSSPEPQSYTTRRAPPPVPALIRPQNADPSRYPYPRPTSPLLGPAWTVRDAYVPRVPPVVPAAHSQSTVQPLPRPISPRIPPQNARSPPHSPYLHQPCRTSPIGQPHVYEQTARPARTQGPRTSWYGPDDRGTVPSSLETSQNNYGSTSHSESHAPGSSRGRGPVTGKASPETDAQRAARRYQPYSPGRKTSDEQAAPNASSTTSEPISPPHMQQRTLMDRISSNNREVDKLDKAPHVPENHHPYEQSSQTRARGNAQRGRGTTGGGRKKLAARLSDSQGKGS